VRDEVPKSEKYGEGSALGMGFGKEHSPLPREKCKLYAEKVTFSACFVTNCTFLLHIG